MIPHFLHYKSAIRSYNSSAQYKTSQRLLLIYENRRKQILKGKYSAFVESLEKDIKIKLNYNNGKELFQKWQIINRKQLFNLKKKTTSIHKRKLLNLGMPIHGLPSKRLVFNYSSKTLSEAQLKLLEKGPNFGIDNNYTNPFKVKAEMELLMETVKNNQILEPNSIENLKEQMQFETLKYIKQKSL